MDSTDRQDPPDDPEDEAPEAARARLIAESGFFDPGWYLEANPDIAASGADPLQHYLEFGAAELRDPGPRFDAAWYAAQQGEGSPGRSDPLTHYLQTGGARDETVAPGPLDPWALDRAIARLDSDPAAAGPAIAASGFFDADWYARRYHDVERLETDPLSHYLLSGAAERRDPGPRFNARWYAEQHPDDPLAARAPLLHYLAAGGPLDAVVAPPTGDPWLIRRAIEVLDSDPSLAAEAIAQSGFFDPDWYRKANPDLKRSRTSPIQHYLLSGAAEMRDPGPRFNARWYAEQHQDDPLAARAPLLHYLATGGPLDADVGPAQGDPWLVARAAAALDSDPALASEVVARSGFFDPQWYVETNPGVRRSGADPLEHYILAGAAEMRDPGPRFNARWYGEQHPDDPLAARAPILHYLLAGGAPDADVQPPPGDPWLIRRAIAALDSDPALAAKVIASSGFFDPDWYVETNSDVRRSGADPIDHYVSTGSAEQRDPGPRFDARWYAAAHEGDALAARAPVLHFLLSGGSPEADVGGRGRIAKVALRLLDGLDGLDPDFAGLAAEIGRIRAPFKEGRRRDAAAAAWRRLFASLARPYDRIVFIPRSEGRELEAVLSAGATLAPDIARSILLVVADGPRLNSLDRLPPDLDARVLSDLAPGLAAQDRIDLASWLIWAVEPRSVLNMNCRTAWEAFRGRGAALASFCDLHAALDRAEDQAEGERVDRNLRSAIEHLTAAHLQDAAFAGELTARLALPRRLAGRLRVVDKPSLLSFLGA